MKKILFIIILLAIIVYTTIYGINSKTDQSKNIQNITLDCVDSKLVREVLIEKKLSIAISACDNELKEYLAHTNFRDINIAFRNALLALVIANNAAPYGSSSVTDYDALILETALDCDNYAALLAHLVPNLKLIFVGFDGGAVGNHAQILLLTEERGLLLDPTIGIAALTTYNNLLIGTPIDEKSILSVYPKPKSVDAINIHFHNKVINALNKGLYKPSDALYYYEDLEHFLQTNNKKDGYYRYITPGGESLRRRALHK